MTAAPGAICVLTTPDSMQSGEPGHEQPSRQDRRLGYGLINAGRHRRGYRGREAAQWLDRIHAPRHGRRARHLGRPARRHWPAPCDGVAGAPGL